ncbi:MAG: hypothetical protein CL916_04910 [Deltaproteobacteria bacterium]|nr:hypothetical protein [Deltaproteobacteria bacterium]
MIKQGKDKQYFSKSVCQELYCEYITLASHIDQLNSIDHSVYTMMESCLKDDLEFFVRYVCIRLNKDLHQIKPKQALETAQTLMSRLSNLPNLPILPMKLHESELRTYPVSYCYLWNTLALVMASNGEVDKALGLVKLAVKRTLLNEYSSLADLVRYNCRLGQILSVSGQSAEAIEVLKEVIKSLDDQAMVSDQQLETTRIFVHIYLARALAHQGLASEANHYYRLSEQMGGGAVELLFAKFEIRFLLSIYHYEDYQSVSNDWLHEQSKLESEIRQLHKYTIDRVETVAVFTNFLIQQEKSISAEDLVDLSKIYKNQYIEHGHCAVF